MTGGLLDTLFPRDREDRGAAVRAFLNSGDRYNLQETDNTGVNAFWLSSVFWTDASLVEIAALLSAARGLTTTDEGADRMLVHCAEADGTLTMTASTAPCTPHFSQSDPDATSPIATELKLPVHARDTLRDAGWRWVVNKRAAIDAIRAGKHEVDVSDAVLVDTPGKTFFPEDVRDALVLALNSPAGMAPSDQGRLSEDQQGNLRAALEALGDGLVSREAISDVLREQLKDLEFEEHLNIWWAGRQRLMEVVETSSDWALLTRNEATGRLALRGVLVEPRLVLAMTAMAPYARRQAFCGVWMACRVGNVPLLEKLTEPGTPWAAIMRKQFITDEGFGEVWREMPLPQRFMTYPQAAIMSANLDLVKLLEERLGREHFWESCRMYNGGGLVEEETLSMMLREVANALCHCGLIVNANGDSPTPKRQKKSDSGDPPLPADTSGGDMEPRLKRLHGWGMAQAAAVHVFIRESERPLTDSITGYVRNARGDLDESDEDLHGPNVLERSQGVLDHVMAQLAADTQVQSLLQGPEATLEAVLVRFALPFCFAVESGNQPAFLRVCREMESVLDGPESPWRVDVSALGKPTAAGIVPPLRAKAVLVSDLIKGALAEVALDGYTQAGSARSSIWYGVIAPFRFAKELTGRNPAWGGARGMHGGGPDVNAFPREYSGGAFCRHVLLEGLILPLSLLHPYLFDDVDRYSVWPSALCNGTRCSRIGTPIVGVCYRGDDDESRCTYCKRENDTPHTLATANTELLKPYPAWFDDVRAWLAHRAGITSTGQTSENDARFWAGFYSRLFGKHGVRGVQKMRCFSEEGACLVEWDHERGAEYEFNINYALCGYCPRASAQ